DSAADYDLPSAAVDRLWRAGTAVGETGDMTVPWIYGGRGAANARWGASRGRLAVRSKRSLHRRLPCTANAQPCDMNSRPSDVTVRHNAAENRFEAEVEGRLSVADYQL